MPGQSAGSWQGGSCPGAPEEGERVKTEMNMIFNRIILSCSMQRTSFFSVFMVQNVGVATFVQGTAVQGDHGPRGQMSKGQLSKEILV